MTLGKRKLGFSKRTKQRHRQEEKLNKMAQQLDSREILRKYTKYLKDETDQQANSENSNIYTDEYNIIETLVPIQNNFIDDHDNEESKGQLSRDDTIEESAIIDCCEESNSNESQPNESLYEHRC